MRQVEAVVERARNVRPTTRDHLANWIASYTGIHLGRTAVCEGHSSQIDVIGEWFVDRPSSSFLVGSRGSGKSFMAGIKSHLDSRFYPGHSARVLGGSKAQSKQIHGALEEAVLDGSGLGGTDADTILDLQAEAAIYRNGSRVSILAASSRSVRGPHVPNLYLDEVDEIDRDVRESADGMVMRKNGMAAQIIMTSTWHRLGGPVEELIELGKSGAFPVRFLCVWEVLEPCPVDRSGPTLEKCPECPLVRWCHSDMDRVGLPKAKRSSGHYSIDAMIDKVRRLAPRVIEADYFCLGPKAEGLWFSRFSPDIHVRESSDYDPARGVVHLGIDTGVFTGAVLFQVRQLPDRTDEVTVFAEHLAEDRPPAEHAAAIKSLAHTYCQDRIDKRTCDPATKSRSASSVNLMAEYASAGLSLTPWPIFGVTASLAIVEALVEAGDGQTRLFIHPRCKHLIRAFQSYARAQRGGQMMDWPEDPQHPHEDLIDALRGSLQSYFPEGRKPAKVHRRTIRGNPI